jgi:hypothetical protein
MEAEIKVDLSASQKAEEVFKRGFTKYALAETMEAVEAGSHQIQGEWMKYISGAPVSYSGGDFVIHRVTGQYASAVMNGLRYPMNGDAFMGGVVVELDYADKLERGFSTYDMKPGMLNSPKVKFTKPDPADPGANTEPYIDVPFEHAEAGIPKAVKSEVKKTGTALGLIRLGKGLGRAQAGIRSKIAPRELGLEDYTWRTGLFANLTRKVSGPENRGKYMTFRRISGNSDASSWIHPGVSPKPVTKAIVENIGAQLQGMVSLAFQKDVSSLMRLSGLMP